MESTGGVKELEYDCIGSVGVSKLSTEPRELPLSVEEFGLDNRAHCIGKSLWRGKDKENQFKHLNIKLLTCLIYFTK